MQFNNNQILVMVGETGSGKTTQCVLSLPRLRVRCVCVLIVRVDFVGSRSSSRTRTCRS